jgi:ribonucleoside-diphosphate reductase alpha chain
MPHGEISMKFWDAKYRLRDPDGTPIDQYIEDTWLRVARALAQPERDVDTWASQFYWAMEDYKFIPGGRILAGAGTGRNVTMMNCYVMGPIDDSMEGIFSALSEAALTLKQGGGIGHDFSTIRPAGSYVNGTGSRARGPLAFMRCWDAMSQTMVDAHDRLGAMMATLRCDHPDIEAFIEAKRDKAELRHFNLSVLVTDQFMAKVREGGSWGLKFNGEVVQWVDARELWDRLMRATFDVADPGVIFIDRINQENNLYYCEDITCTNPCGEVPQGPYSSCLLGSLNLAAFVTEPFTPDAAIDVELLETVVPVAIRMLDNVVDISNFPLPQQAEQARAKRRMGMGITGLADALVMCGLRYGSDAAVEETNAWMSIIETTAYLASADLAEEKGPFPLYASDLYCEGKRFKRLPQAVQDRVKRKGMRNSHLMAVAPTGTISLFAGNVSGGVEPVFSHFYNRKVLQGNGSHVTEKVDDFAYRQWCELRGDEPLPGSFVTTHELTWKQHIDMLAAAQNHVDQSISKTINLPRDISFEEFKDVYHYAYDVGAKSCTTYRPNDVTGSVLSVDEAPKMPVLMAVAAAPLRHRPEELTGTTYKLRWDGKSLYVTINDTIEPDGRRVPYEIFVRAKSADYDHWLRALTRTMSAVMRRDADFGFLATELMQIYSARGGEFINQRYVASEVALIGDCLRRHMIKVGYITGEAPSVSVMPGDHGVGYGELGSECPSCYAPAVIRVEGCAKCTSCGWSNCG